MSFKNKLIQEKVEVERKKKFPENGSSEATGNHPNVKMQRRISWKWLNCQYAWSRAMEKGRWWQPSFLRNCLSSTRRGPPIMRSSVRVSQIIILLSLSLFVFLQLCSQLGFCCLFLPLYVAKIFRCCEDVLILIN